MFWYRNLYQLAFFVNNKKSDTFFKVIDSDPAITFCRKTFFRSFIQNIISKIFNNFNNNKSK